MSPGRRLGREAASEVLSPHLSPVAGARALAKAAAMARTALVTLGDDVPGMLVAEGGFLRFDGVDLDSDFEAHQNALRLGLSMVSGPARDDCLVTALAEEGVLLEDEPYADWSIGPREALEALRQEARLALARDRARGYGRTGGVDVAHAWEECFAHDPACEEA
ncbi:MAG TPA: hypothetical protein VEJ84_14860, partial [Acidimicrobiales bacterium]|nr:hypothetical protein [Acidimicrobiales bacterium]